MESTYSTKQNGRHCRNGRQPSFGMTFMDISNNQLVQAMAGFSGGAADTSTTAPLSADTLQQTFLTAAPVWGGSALASRFAQAVRCRRRHQPRTRPLANIRPIRPGRPAPAIGPGTEAGAAFTAICKVSLTK